MVTVKFETENFGKQLAIFPVAIFDYSDKAEKATISMLFGWLCGALGVSIKWTRKVKNSAANGASAKAKCD